MIYSFQPSSIQSLMNHRLDSRAFECQNCACKKTVVAQILNMAGCRTDFRSACTWRHDEETDREQVREITEMTRRNLHGTPIHKLPQTQKDSIPGAIKKFFFKDCVCGCSLHLQTKRNTALSSIAFTFPFVDSYKGERLCSGDFCVPKFHRF